MEIINNNQSIIEEEKVISLKENTTIYGEVVISSKVAKMINKFVSKHVIWYDNYTNWKMHNNTYNMIKPVLYGLKEFHIQNGLEKKISMLTLRNFVKKLKEENNLDIKISPEAVMRASDIFSPVFIQVKGKGVSNSYYEAKILNLTRAGLVLVGLAYSPLVPECIKFGEE